jgi:mono/diheme cytochrome c family protein
VKAYPEHTYRRWYRSLALAGACLSLGVLTLVAFEDSVWQEWQRYQSAYVVLKGDSSAVSFSPGIRQITIARLAIADRCVSCHLGVEDSLSTGIPLPFTTHSGSTLRQHHLKSFGCTMCHKGDGRDLRVQAVCNQEGSFPDSKESLHFVGASCFRCHGTLFGSASLSGATPETNLGRSLIGSSGCFGCHKIRGVGGVLGPDLSELGEKNRAHFRFRDVEGDRTIPNWLREHFQDPGKLSPGSSMVPYKFGRDSLDALITVLLGLHSPDLPIGYYSIEAIREQKGERHVLDGGQVFAAVCSGCHGQGGQGRSYLVEQPGAPRLSASEFQSTASREMIAFLVARGRGVRPMPAWQPSLSGLLDQEIDAVVNEVRSWKPLAPTVDEVMQTKGDARRGGATYALECATCHGDQGMGGIGPILSSPDLLSAATDRYLIQTITTGRRNTAMPSWSHFNAQQIADLLLFLRSWQPEASPANHRRAEGGDVAAGSQTFASICARCHGIYGEGGIGPAILNSDFLDAASDAFLLQTLERGRQHSPMFGLGITPGRVSSDLVAFMRSMRDSVLDFIPPGASLGQPKQGQALYSTLCSDCHGKYGEGRKAPALNNEEFLNAATNGFLLSTISLGRSGTPMPAWGRQSPSHRVLTTGERQDIVAFIRIWQMGTMRKP